LQKRRHRAFNLSVLESKLAGKRVQLRGACGKRNADTSISTAGSCP